MNIENLKELRIKAGLTQTELAILVGVTMISVARWEQGSNAPSEDNMIKLEEVLEEK